MKKLYQTLLIIILSFGALWQVKAQTGTPQYTFTPSGPVNTGNSVPLAYQPDMRSQMCMPGGIFPSAPSGLGISAIYFRIYTAIAPPASESHSTYKVYAGNAPSVNSLSITNWESISNLTLALDAPGYTYTNMTGGAWLKIPFTTVVPYNPTQPLLLDFQWTSRSNTANWYLDCSGTGQPGFALTYNPSVTATAPTTSQIYVYMFGVDLAPLPSSIPKIPPLANYKPMNDLDTFWVGSPSVLVNTSSYSDTNYWAITGYNATTPNGTWSPYSNPKDVIQCNGRGCWQDTIVNKVNLYYTFPQAGYYRVKLFTANKYGTSYVEKPVYVSNPVRKPSALFMSTKRNIAIYDRSQFNDLSADGPTSWKWWLDPPCYTCGLYINKFFYNGSVNDTVASPYLQAADPGMYSVCLAVSNAMGSDTFCQPSYIKVIAGYQMCNGADTVGKEAEGAVMPVQIQGNSQMQYVANGCSQGFRIAPCADTIMITLDRLRLRNNGSSLSPGDSLYIKTGLLAGSPILRRWGGNDINNIKDSLRTLKFAGQQVFVIYTPVAPNGPTTIVNDSGFLVHWTSKPATFAPPVAAFTCPDTVYSGYKVTFLNQSTGKLQNYAWDINNDGVFGKDKPGQGIDSTTMNPSMTYNEATSVYKTVCLKTYNCVGSDTFCKTFLVLPTQFPPFADFTANKTYGLTTDSFMLLDRSYNGANKWLWQISPLNVTYLGGTDSTSQNPILFFNTNTSYSITLTATNAFGTSMKVKTNFITTISYPSPGSQFPPTSSVEDFGITRVRLVGSIGRIDTTTSLKPTNGSAYTPLYNLSKTTLFRGGTYTVDVYRGSNPVDSMNLRVWIDFNRNANYLDKLEETIISQNKKLIVKTSKEFTVPADASIGTSRMLVGASAGFSSISPYSATLGVYEEYGIIIGRDLIKPVVKLNGNVVTKTELYKPYDDAKATATDNIEGDISSKILAVSDVDINHVGYYTVKYVVADDYGNLSDTVVRTVQVEVNQTGPSITVTGQDTVILNVRQDSYTDAGATAKDNQGNDISHLIITTRNLDTSNVGIYYYTYMVADAFGFISSKQRVIIVRDTIKPTIHTRTLNDTNYVIHQIKTPFDDNTYIRVDDNYWTNLIPVRSGSLDIDKQGIYYLTYTATDGSGNVSATYILTVKVTNTFKPTITLVGSTDVTIKVFSSYNDPKAVAKDYYNTPLVVAISEDELNINKKGYYNRTYSAIDEFGNEATVNRNINVKDLDAPIITVLGDNPVVVASGTSRNEIMKLIDFSSVKVTDNYDQDLIATDDIGNKLFDKPGTYQIIYTAKDKSFNNAQTKQRYLQITPNTGLSQVQGNGSAVQVYPNPSKGMFTVELKQNEVKTIRVYNIAGVLVKEISGDRFNMSYQIDLSNERDGMYLIRVEGTDKVYTAKVTITK